MLLVRYMYLDLIKLKAHKLFEKSDADLSWLLFKEADLFSTMSKFVIRSSVVYVIVLIIFQGSVSRSLNDS